jgi:hypothetical protein
MERLRQTTRRLVTVLAAALPLVVAPACVKVRHPEPRSDERPAPREWSGVLDDYSRLEPGGPDDLTFVYRNPGAQWTRYDAVLLEPVTLWRSGRDSLAAIPEADLLQLVTRFDGALRRRLGTGFRLVEQPGPGVLRIRLAITAARESDKGVDVLTATPDAPQLNGDARVGNEVMKFIDGASLEGEIRDATTDELLAEGVDRRRPGAPHFATWADFDRAVARWADRACTRLEKRAGHRQ